MIKVSIEIVPFGIKQSLQNNTEIIIINNCSNTYRPSFGNYDIVYEGKRFNNIIQNFKRSDGKLKLVSLAVNKLLDEIL